MRIKFELRERGIGKELIARYLMEDDEEWYRLMQAAVAAKVGVSSEVCRQTQQKVARSLEYGGLPTPIIRRYAWDVE